MAIKIDNDLLTQLGLASLPDAEKNSLLRHIYETLEMRVGMRLADQMSNEQLDEFEKYFDAKDDAGAFKWLESNFPNYKDIVQEEFDKLKAEVGASAQQILAASQQSQGAVPQPQQPAPQPVSDPSAQQVQPNAAPQPPQSAPGQAQQQPAAPQPQYPSQQPPAGPGQVPPSQ